jgi:predicted RNA-binding Zn ribbon-like protein
MTYSASRRAPLAAEAPLVGDHLALDLLNTQARNDGEAVDFWTSGEAVLAWLARCGIVPAAGARAPEPDALLAQATALRTLARRLIGAHQQVLAADRAALNGYLLAYLSAPQLESDAEGRLLLARTVRCDALASLLGPLAQAVAQLLVDPHRALVRQCEHPDCVLWFYDRTKAHKRRWCSMALCGNRHKAAQFRKRHTGDAP